MSEVITKIKHYPIICGNELFCTYLLNDINPFSYQWLLKMFLTYFLINHMQLYPWMPRNTTLSALSQDTIFLKGPPTWYIQETGLVIKLKWAKRGVLMNCAAHISFVRRGVCLVLFTNLESCFLGCSHCLWTQSGFPSSLLLILTKRS